MSTALVTASVTAGPSTDSDPEDKFVVLLTYNFYTSLEGSLSLLLKSKKTLFSILKTSLLHCIESIRTVSGPGSITAME